MEGSCNFWCSGYPRAALASLGGGSYGGQDTRRGFLGNPLRGIGRGHRHAAGTVFALLLAGFGSAAASSQPQPALVLEAAVVNARPDARAGVAKAGTLCLPSGRLHVSDFVAGDGDLTDRAQQALSTVRNERGLLAQPPSGRMLKIYLEGIDASLCARKYGMFGLGERRAMSGSMDFHFTWSVSRTGTVAVAPRAETIHLDVRKNEARAVEQFLSDALVALAREIVATENGL